MIKFSNFVVWRSRSLVIVLELEGSTGEGEVTLGPAKLGVKTSVYSYCYIDQLEDYLCLTAPRPIQVSRCVLLLVAPSQLTWSWPLSLVRGIDVSPPFFATSPFFVTNCFSMLPRTFQLASLTESPTPTRSCAA